MEVRAKAKQVRAALKVWQRQSSDQRNSALREMAAQLEASAADILAANEKDLHRAQEIGISGALLDRLTLTEDRVRGMADGLRDVAGQRDPIGQVVDGHELPNGLKIQRVRVPLGVIGMIYEARPNVTADAAGLCLKAGNGVLLRGGSEAIHSNTAVVRVLQRALQMRELPESVVALIENTDRAEVQEMLHLNSLIDVVIPRGGAGLIQFVVENSTVPVIETGVGNCHVFVDASADLPAAVAIVDNAKTQRPGVCNAVETLLVHREAAESFLPELRRVLDPKGVELRGCSKTQSILEGVKPAEAADWSTEFLDLILAVRVVDSYDEAVEHIQAYSTGHSEAILTESYTNAQRFLQEVDAAAVYVNASTRFTDGAQFGMGAEIGISTQKLHARGPMGLAELTTTKFVVYGQGTVRK